MAAHAPKPADMDRSIGASAGLARTSQLSVRASLAEQVALDEP
jgi:hypothetical protein